MADGDAPRRGRPRDAATHQSILDAANSILADRGYRGFSIEAVAATAGVSKTSIYRRWPSKGALLLDLYMMEMGGETFSTAENTPVRETFQTYLNLSVRRLEKPVWTSTIQSLAAEAQADPSLAQLLLEKVILPRRAAGRRLLEHGIREGQIDSAIDIDVVLDSVFGTIWYRLLLGHLPVDQQFADNLIDQLFRWIGKDSP